MSASGGDSEAMERRILLAHEDPDSRRIYRTALEFAGWSVVDTDDGDEALDLLGQERFGAVVTDLFVRGRNDDLLVRRIRAIPSLDHVPIIVLTGWSSSDHEIAALREGADAFLVMPVTPQRLVLTLESFAVQEELTNQPALPSESSEGPELRS